MINTGNAALRRRFFVLFGVAVSGVLLWLAFRETDLDAINAALTQADARYAAPFLISLFAFYWLKSARWGYLLSHNIDTSTRSLFPIVMIGYAGTAVLPMQMGEFVRAYIASRRFTLPYSLVLSSIGVERLFDLLTILGILGLVLAVGQATPIALINAGYAIGAITLAGAAVVILLATRRRAFLEMTQRLLTPFPERFGSFIIRQFDAAAQGFESLTRLGVVLRVAANSVVQWALMGVCIWCSLTALQIDASAATVATVLVATIIGISLPTSPGYVGNIQFAFVVGLQPFGVTADAALAASIFYHVLAYVAVVVVGFGFLHRYGLGIREIQRQARATSDASDTR